MVELTVKSLRHMWKLFFGPSLTSFPLASRSSVFYAFFQFQSFFRTQLLLFCNNAPQTAVEGVENLRYSSATEYQKHT